MGLGPGLVAELEAVVGAEHVRTGRGDLEPYSRDATPMFRGVPDAVVWPRTAEEVAAVLRLATRHGVPVVPRGAGSNLSAGTLADRGGIVLVLTRMTSILEVDADELLARVEAGVTTAALAEAAAAKGLLYAPDPGSRTVSTVGGNVATCAGGLRGLKYGVTRNYVLGTTAVLPTGEIIRTGGRLWKDVAGYDLTRLLTGSEGTLGVLTEITVALLPMPATAGTGVAYFPTLADAGRAVTAVIGAGIVPATLEFLDAKCIGAVEDYAHLGLRRDAGALLLFGDDGTDDVVARTLDRIGELSTRHAALEVTLAEDVARSEALLAARRCALPALSRLGTLTILEDATVPRPRLAEMVDRIDEIAARHDVDIATFGHAGDGNLHPTCVVDRHDEDAAQRAHKAFGDVFAAAIAMDGTITGEHGVGAAKLPYLQDRLGADQVALLRRIKAAFDPAGILNPGKLGS
ncbi:FAD-binding protein [Pseudonocardia sp. KRD-184]|uniref:FAD-binding protein n=1 Tax=Pseudonocardia oceani TaxID=2792013 RepID=A0ABS6UIY2_9PSEU|nr:FAD-linked oxidase C-terminal domain-containing protein [Pseudonocardia oceani]MBW0091889.1 FAD-binding protein [Pseudonocardia oceani]MBW0097911.1 FAD-binding protein [Pseudonocardia oceani]MBW0109332.1 FAD-binding protein [Pseudonocardia oceani]MBW0124522.1 FAD-binding protein [Pseudonocardia oceani]MBW0131863.1 FAD-binding protein [Pseudonocardia oceani]